MSCVGRSMWLRAVQCRVSSPQPHGGHVVGSSAPPRATPPRSRAFSSSSSLGSARVQQLGTTVFTEFTQLGIKHKAVQLGQGFPAWNAPDFVKEAARASIADNINQYTRSAGHPPLVTQLTDTYSPLFERKLEALDNFVVFNGASEAGFATMQALVNPGDEVILAEPFYDAYPRWVEMAGGVPKYITMSPSSSPSSAASEWSIDPKALEAAITPRTKLVVFNNPHNPLGKVFERGEMEALRDVIVGNDLLAVSDEAYEWVVFPPRQHIRLATIPGMWDRTITLCSAGKTFSATGWKIGWTVAPAEICKALASCQQWMPFCVASPLQEAVSRCLREAEQRGYFEELATMYQCKRDLLASGLTSAGLQPIVPDGGYFVMADTSKIVLPTPPAAEANDARDYQMCRHLIREFGVVGIPPSAFVSPGNAALTSNFARFAFCKEDDEIVQGCERLSKATQTP